ncbi:Gfo/Idh/MocA family protein [Bosea sp. 2RAB26]|jgi:predicted dehydrogenase|uniref:Gfo/Idh/MocA family protein n=1 Tax=Bosea sp. 2RAB26 TaxID=3237476 RepID=UPI003F92C23A
MASGDAAPIGAERFCWGIIGTGVIARQFAADLALLPDARIGAVQSRALEKAQAFAAEFGATVAYGDAETLLADPAIDALYIATPNALHVAQGLRGIAAGKPVLIEKPIALTAADVHSVIEASRAHRVFAMEAMWTRFLPAVVAAREQVAAGRIGKVRRIRADLSYVREDIPGSRFFDPALGGGSAFDLGVYPVSLALHWLGSPERVTGRWLEARSGVDRRCEIVLHYREAVAELSCGFDRNGGNQFVIEGAAGAIRLDAPFLKAQRLTHYTTAALGSSWRGPRLRNGPAGKLLDRLPMPGRTREIYSFAGNGLQFQARAVMDAVRSGETGCATMPLTESAAVLNIIETVLAQPPVKTF